MMPKYLITVTETVERDVEVELEGDQEEAWGHVVELCDAELVELMDNGVPKDERVVDRNVSMAAS